MSRIHKLLEWHKVARLCGCAVLLIALLFATERVQAEEDEQFRTCTVASTGQCFESCSTATAQACTQLCTACGDGYVPSPGNPSGNLHTGNALNCDPSCGPFNPCCAWRSCGCRLPLPE